LIRSAPRSWKEILQHFKGQNYRDVYRAFGQLRSRLGRVVQPPFFPYGFSDTGDFIEATPTAPSTSIDRLHHKS
jgi:4-hydroxy-3-polyprenylbenzoate decarboxylase